MAIAVSQGKLERKRTETEILNEIRDGLSLSLEANLAIVVKLGLETHEAVEHELFNGGGYVYLALARLLEAYGSRVSPSGTVYLAAQKRLLKEYCSGFARLHFDQIHNLKKNLIFRRSVSNSHPPRCCGSFWTLDLQSIACLKEPFVDPNKDFLSVRVMQQLRYIRDEMPGLMNTATMKHRQG
ncbi:hypothetical protein B0O99DRAFT_694082 [Bisporella sp. PMI_857]|nr:hypothetical protein B0O99DRAFT_694082 [Bisporella sp. PMI_857]